MKAKWWLNAVAVSAIVVSAGAYADSLSEQRERYQAIKMAWDNNDMAQVEKLMPTLTTYPLYPYLEYRELTQDLSILSPRQVNEFISKHPTLPSSSTLKTRFITELAKREDWQGLLAFSPEPPKAMAPRCNYYYANWAVGQKQVAWEGAKSVWLNGTSLPNSCDKLFSVWQQANLLTPELVLERISLALKKGNNSLVSYLAKQLPPSYSTMSDALVALQKNPATVDQFAKLSPTDFTREATLNGFSAYARQSPDAARLDLDAIAFNQKMNSAEKQKMRDSIAWQYMGDVSAENERWRDETIQDSDSITLKERRVRLALANQDNVDLQRWLDRLPAEAQQKEEWQYWRARILLSQGKTQQANDILNKIAEGRGFYPMVAAQQLGKPYVMMINKALRPDSSIKNLPEVARVRELMYWQLDNLARTEWLNLLSSRTPEQKEQLARYAFENNWADLSVLSTINAKLWDHLEERFPLAWQEEFTEFTRNKGISKSYAMAIARQESGWNPQISSPVGATGLMQIMPATAKEVVKKSNIDNYVNSSQLVNPRKNIEIGTAYLDSVYQRFGNNRILASAAYNAGPSRVDRWLSNSGGRLDAVAFVETIPFAETRGYVKNVLSFDIFYQNFLENSKKINVLTKSEWDSRY